MTLRWVFSCFGLPARGGRAKSGESASGGQTSGPSAKVQLGTTGTPLSSGPVGRWFSKVRSYVAGLCCGFHRSNTSEDTPPEAGEGVEEAHRIIKLNDVIGPNNESFDRSQLKGAIIDGTFNAERMLRAVSDLPSGVDQIIGTFETMRQDGASLENVKVTGELGFDDPGAMKFLKAATSDEVQAWSADVSLVKLTGVGNITDEPTRKRIVDMAKRGIDVHNLTWIGHIVDPHTADDAAKLLRLVTQLGRAGPNPEQVVLELAVTFNAQVLEDVKYLVERGAKLQHLRSIGNTINIDPIDGADDITDVSESRRTLAAILELHAKHPKLNLLSAKIVQVTFDIVKSDETILDLFKRALKVHAQVAIVGKVSVTKKNLELALTLRRMGANVDGIIFAVGEDDLPIGPQDWPAVGTMLNALESLGVDVKSLRSRLNELMTPQ
jgi:hypothetical protein